MKDEKLDTTERLARLLLLLEPTRDEILERHEAAIDAWVAKCCKEKTPVLGRLIELCRGLYVRLTPNMDEFRAGFGVLVGAKSLATRGAGVKGANPESAVPAPVAEPGGQFVGKGERCFGQLFVRPQPDGRLVVEIALRDEQWNPVNPFFLTVRQESKILLNRKRIDGDRYQVENIDPAAYQFELTDIAGQRRVAMGWSAA